MISCESYIDLQKEIQTENVCDFSNDELLAFVLRMIIKFSSPRYLHKIVEFENAIEIAKTWMSGQEYYIIQNIAELANCVIIRKKRKAIISLDEVTSICDSDFGYTASLIINSICEILKPNVVSDENDGEDSWSNTIDQLQKLSQQLKYGLPEQTDIFIYELGFNDRFLAQEIRKIIGSQIKKKDTKKAIIQNRNDVANLLSDYPSVFLYRLKALS